MEKTKFCDVVIAMELKHGREAFYLLPDNHPDMKKVIALAPKSNRTGFREFPSMTWDSDKVRFLINHYMTMTNQELADYFGTGRDSIRAQLYARGLKRRV